MKLFHWNKSIALERYAAGDIIVMAETVEQARVTALEQFQVWAKTEDSRFGWMFYVPMERWDEHELEDWNKIVAQFSADLLAEPTSDAVAIFMAGSE